MPGDWDDIIHGEEESLGYYNGKTIDLREKQNVQKSPVAVAVKFMRPVI